MNGALIIEKASNQTMDTVYELYKAIHQEEKRLSIVIEDTKKARDSFLKDKVEFKTCFTSRMDIEALDNDTLVLFGKKYAKDMEYSIDELGILALHTCISDMQTSDHIVTIVDVKEIIDNAINRANRKNVSHFFDILLSKRYDDEDMIILREDDFI